MNFEEKFLNFVEKATKPDPNAITTKDLKDLTPEERKKMLIIVLSLIALVIMLSALIITFDEHKSTKIVQQNNSPATQLPEKASAQLAENLQFTLNRGYKLVNANKIYITKSKDFASVYFIGTLIENSGQIYPCIWASNSEKMDGITMSANDFAVKATSLPDGRKSEISISQSDDGYGRINSQILTDMAAIVK